LNIYNKYSNTNLNKFLLLEKVFMGLF